jgi:hypothetical protein
MDQEYDKKSMNGNFILSQMLKFADLEMVAQKTKKNISHLIYNEILQNRPVFLGILVYGDMGNAPGGFVTLPKEGTYSDGGHAILATGYLVKDGKEYVKFRNSWGKNWGEKGNGYLPSEYLKDNLIGAYSLWLDDLLVKSERLLAANPLVQEKREQSA